MTLDSQNNRRLRRKIIFEALSFRYNQIAENGVDEKNINYLTILWTLIKKFKDD